MDACRQSNNGSRVDRFGWRRVIGHPQHLTLIASYRESEALTAQMACAKRLCLYTREVRAQIRVRVWVAHRKIWAQNRQQNSRIQFASSNAWHRRRGTQPRLNHTCYKSTLATKAHLLQKHAKRMSGKLGWARRRCAGDRASSGRCEPSQIVSFAYSADQFHESVECCKLDSPLPELGNDVGEEQVVILSTSGKCAPLLPQQEQSSPPPVRSRR